MDHKVANVQQLHDDAMYLYNNLVVGGENSADYILNNLSQSVDNLKSNWKGRDAGVRIQEIIEVHNAMVTVRNALAHLSSDSSRVAVNYRNIQIANGAGLDELAVINFDTKSRLTEHTDTADTIDINPQAEVGRNLIDGANNALDTFRVEVKTRYDDIMGNWTVGSGRNAAKDAFDSFSANVNKYKETLTEVSSNITKALQNYNF